MFMYVANITHQNFDFQWQVKPPGALHPRLMRALITPGTQVKLGYEFTDAERDSVVSHHERFGLTPASEIDRTRTFVPAIWSDAPISKARIERGYEHNLELLDIAGQEERKRAALAMSAAVDTNPNNPLRALDLTIEEQQRDGTTGSGVREQIVVTDDMAREADKRAARSSGRTNGRTKRSRRN